MRELNSKVGGHALLGLRPYNPPLTSKQTNIFLILLSLNHMLPMTSSQATIIYDVWAFHSILADTGISQAGVILIHEGGKSVENDYHLCAYHTSRDLSRWRTSYKQSLQCSLGGNMTYKGKVFGDDVVPFDSICRSVEPIARNLGVPLNSAADWIETWEDYMSRANIAHILFDRPEKLPIEVISPDSYSQPRNDHPSLYSFESVDWNNMSYKPQRNDVPDQKNYRKSQGSSMEPHHKYSARQQYVSRDLESSDDGLDYPGEEEEFHESRSARHSRLPRGHRQVDEPSGKPENKKLKYAGMIAETVTANAIGDVFGLIFESVIGAIL
ncbi:uncharacterized protein Bfra_000327 [Botrytis fragariae]|uniref:Uncharacterized protein n=1 Tax=Botrytis fragariae TaxID=1964551 RepID=A0A8H6EN96_9HELO|nr:uncharacterized protein Bfra_000327 [Botrytis fragariae]KAF5878160.1 hypothetical protein Bfra_000327 [Botrytis fragariae]